MGCFIEFSNSFIQLELNNQPVLQKLIIDILLRYNNDSVSDLAKTLDIPAMQLRKIRKGEDFLEAQKSHDLAQQFLLFLARTFFNSCSIIRNYDP